MNIEERIKVRMENAYIEYIRLCGQTDCLGADMKMELGRFGRKELEAHKSAAIEYGKHKAFADVLRILQEADHDRE